MTRRKEKGIPYYWLNYINQKDRISPETQSLVQAMRTRIDQLELANALLRGQLRAAGIDVDSMEHG